MKKRWTTLSSECDHEVARLRAAFLKEHENACQIVMSETGVPLQAIYRSPECPGFGEIDERVAGYLPQAREVNLDSDIEYKK